MNSDCRNRALESRLVGQWKCSSERETCEYVFLPHNEYTCVVTRAGESPFKVRGYWDVLGTQLRIGTSALAAEPAELQMSRMDSFSAKLPGGTVVTFQKMDRA